MNLADAIRKAAADVNGHPSFAATPEPRVDAALQGVPEPKPAPTFQSQPEPKVAPMAEPEPAKAVAAPKPCTAVPEPPVVQDAEGKDAFMSVNGGNVVRLEIFMSPEQMTGMLKAIMAGQHSVMTLREAAAYLRTTPATLERLADVGDIPAVEIDGRWRFPKPHLDEWLAQHRGQQEDGEDVA